MLAIRFPKDYDARFEGEGLTNVNLFRYVFSYLSGRDEILEARVADDGYIEREAAAYAVEKALANGRILDAFVLHEP